MTSSAWSNRHTSVRHFEPYFGTQHLAEPLAAISRPFGRLADELLGLLTDDSPEVSACLRKLVEAKDCAVRARVAELQRAQPDPLGGSVQTADEILKAAGHTPPGGER